MTAVEIDALANKVLLSYLDDGPEFAYVYQRDDCQGLPESEQKTIHKRAVAFCEQVADLVRSGDAGMTQTPRHSEPVDGPVLPAPAPSSFRLPTGSLGTGTGQPVAERAAAGQQDGQPESARQILAEVIAGALRAIKPAHPDPAGWLTQVLLDLGYRPPAQLIGTAESLDALPDKTIIRTGYDTAAQKSDDVWEFPNEVGQYLSEAIDMPATVLWLPPAVREAHDDN